MTTRNDILIVDETFVSMPQDFSKGALLAKNGLFLFNRLTIGVTPLVDVLQKVGPGYDAKGMKSLIEQTQTYAPRIARKQLLEVESFFRQVYRQYGGEAIVFLYFTPAQGGKWRFLAIPQEVDGAHLTYKTPGGTPNGWFLAGSFHSHHVMSAFHSGTDNNDELEWDGIHVTIGKITSPTPEYAASVVINGTRFKVNIDDLVETAEPVNIPVGWIDQVTRHEPADKKWLARNGEPTKGGLLASQGAQG